MSETWTELKSDIAKSRNDILLCPESERPDNSLLEKLGISDKSTLGAMLKYSSGILVLNGFLRLFGGKRSEFVEAAENWNNFPGAEKKQHIPDECVFVGYDLLGGMFAINGGFFGPELGKIFYFAPASLTWENLGIGHSQFIGWCISGDVANFYDPLSWTNRAEYSKKVLAGFGISSYPFPWSLEGKDLESTSKRVVPLLEIWKMNEEFATNFRSEASE